MKINSTIIEMLDDIIELCGPAGNEHVTKLTSFIERTEDGDFFTCSEKDIQEILKILFAIVYAQSDYIKSAEDMMKKYRSRLTSLHFQLENKFKS